MSGIVLGYDVTHEFLPKAPKGAQLAGYCTGSPNIVWTNSDWSANPNAVRIDQSPVNTALDETADVLDYESGAATLADIGPWAHAALANFASGKRPGQRTPLVYASASNLTPVANALVAAKLDNGSVGFWVASWGVGEPNAATAIMAASGPFPVRAWQYANMGLYDADVFDAAWLNHRSAKPVTTPPVTSGVVIDSGLEVFKVTSTDKKTWKV